MKTALLLLLIALPGCMGHYWTPEEIRADNQRRARQVNCVTTNVGGTLLTQCH